LVQHRLPSYSDKTLTAVASAITSFSELPVDRSNLNARKAARGALIAAGAIPALLQFCNSGRSAPVETVTMLALETFCSLSDAAATFVAADGVKKMLSCLDSNGAKRRQLAAVILCDLASNGCQEAQQALGHRRGLAARVQVQCLQDEECQLAHVYVLKTKMKVMARRGGEVGRSAIATLATALLRDSASLAVRQQAACVLHDAAVAGAGAAVAEAGALPLMLRLLSGASSETVEQAVIGTLRSVSMASVECRAAVVAAGGIPVLLQALNNTEEQLDALLTVAALAGGSGDHFESLVAAGLGYAAVPQWANGQLKALQTAVEEMPDVAQDLVKSGLQRMLQLIAPPEAAKSVATADEQPQPPAMPGDTASATVQPSSAGAGAASRGGWQQPEAQPGSSKVAQRNRGWRPAKHPSSTGRANCRQSLRCRGLRRDQRLEALLRVSA
jgi:hypothetical protein